MPALKDNLLKYGVLKCRDLVELYYGWRVVVSITETNPPVNDASTVQILQLDLRRIRYEIILANSGGGPISAFIATNPDLVNTVPQSYFVEAGDTVQIERDFLTDMEGVTLPLWCAIANNGLFVSVRETFLTPAPIDEVPLG